MKLFEQVIALFCDHWPLPLAGANSCFSPVAHKSNFEVFSSFTGCDLADGCPASRSPAGITDLLLLEEKAGDTHVR